MSAPPRVPPVPAVLRLVQMMVLGRWRATGEELYREVASLMEASPGKEILVSGAGEGETSEWLAARTGASVTGVDVDEARVERAEARARGLKTPLALSYQHGQLDDLPHETNVFDAALAEPLVSAAKDPERAVAELARVTKPMGPVVLLELTWSSDLSESAREMLVERLGLRPRLLIEWKQMMREAGLVEIQVQDWTEAGAKAAAEEEEPVLTWQQKVQIAGRAWRQLGWKGARVAVARERALLKELTRERVLGFQLLKGVKWPHARQES
ncbi:MAG TPA: methyltransferase domain-containing protein [Gemmatimonadaceae bacterium]|nr:methyltransferase domain-containing protein [Gemmatimonadaceae bacterium]